MNERNITAKKLTTDLGLSHSAITHWKQGRAVPSASALFKIARYFNVSTDYILGLIDEPESIFSPELHDSLMMKMNSYYNNNKKDNENEKCLANVDDIKNMPLFQDTVKKIIDERVAEYEKATQHIVSTFHKCSDKDKALILLLIEKIENSSDNI
jgi:transcriptional regulator with XRE-family HTH domain